jgi:hypothetical protein
VPPTAAVLFVLEKSSVLGISPLDNIYFLQNLHSIGSQSHLSNQRQWIQAFIYFLHASVTTLGMCVGF